MKIIQKAKEIVGSHTEERHSTKGTNEWCLNREGSKGVKTCEKDTTITE